MKSDNFAKLLIQGGDILRIVEIVVYGGDGIIINDANKYVNH